MAGVFVVVFIFASFFSSANKHLRSQPTHAHSGIRASRYCVQNEIELLRTDEGIWIGIQNDFVDSGLWAASAAHSTFFIPDKWNECAARNCGSKSLGSQCFVWLCILIKQTVTVEMTSFSAPVEFHSGFSHSFLAQRKEASSNTTATFLDSATEHT